MARGQSIQRVDQPVNAVWRMLADHHAIATWAPGMAVHMERDGEPDPAGTGAIRVINGPGLRIREEITAFDPPRRMAYRALSGVPLPGWAGEVELAEHAGGTVIRWSVTSTTNLPGAGAALDVAARFLLSALIRSVRRADETTCSGQRARSQSR